MSFVRRSMWFAVWFAVGCGGDDAGVTLPSGNADTAPVRAADTAETPIPSSCTAPTDCPALASRCTAEGVCAPCTAEETAACPADKVCFDGLCLGCSAGGSVCTGDGRLATCSADGAEVASLEICPEGGLCLLGQCFTCYPDTRKCEAHIAYECDAENDQWVEIEDCGAQGALCVMGTCISPCSGDFKANTNAGCEFFAVDLDNAVQEVGGLTRDSWNAQFAVIASNTSGEYAATVTVTLPDGSQIAREVAPLSLETIELPPDWGQDGTHRSLSAFRIRATRPITVYQFNPLSNVGNFSSDASVLLPAAGLGNEYYVMSHRQLYAQLRGFLTVVGITEAPTQATVRVTTKTLAGADIPALGPGESVTFSLGIGEVVNIESDEPSGDLTGSHVEATGPIQVMSGHEAAITGERCCADHLEQQMVPVSTWGTEYVMARSVERWAEPDYFRLLAAKDGTEVTVEPAVVQPSTFTLDAGELFEIASTQHFRISASAELGVAHLLASSFEILPGAASGLNSCETALDCPPEYTCVELACGPPACGSLADCPKGHRCAADGECQPLGDPALILGVPVAQWRKSYVFLTPPGYGWDYVNIVAPLDVDVALDSTLLGADAFQPAWEGAAYRVYRGDLSDGVHRVEASSPVGVTVYGWDEDISYGYPAGVGIDAL